MRNDIQGIAISGGIFKSKATLPLFMDAKDRNVFFSFVYGRNGSGKSTIARAFKGIAGCEFYDVLKANLIDKLGNNIVLSDEEKSNIFVFDQKFIDDNIKFKEDGLNTIVMLGAQVELDTRIDEIKNIVFENDKKMVCLEEEIASYENPSSEKSPSYYLNKMKEALKGDTNWAGRDKKIKGTARINTAVTDSTYKQFVYLKPGNTRDELLVLFAKNYTVLEGFRSGNQIISQRVPELEIDLDVDTLINLLNKRIEKPILNSRDKLLLEVLSKREASFLTDINKTFSNDTTNYCPFCTKTISLEEKHELVVAVEKVLGDLVKEHQNALSNIEAKELVFNLAAFEKLGILKETCAIRISEYNDIIKKFNRYIKQKIENPYQPLEITALAFEQNKSKLQESLNALELAREEYNKKVSNTDELREKLIKINAFIAYYDIHDLYKCYEKRKDEYDKLKNEYADLQGKNGKIKIELGELISKKKNYNIALDEINKALSYIFYSRNRIRIKFEDDKYYVLVNGTKVSPFEISTGETNVIALCYFFSIIGKGKVLEEIFKRNYLIVVDDPITSFDADNKVGVLSYLNKQIHFFVKGNKNTKFVLMTHDAMIMTNMEGIKKELSQYYQSVHGEAGVATSWHLHSNALTTFELKIDAYTKLLKDTFEYANSDEESNDLPIGNIMRQLVEAFSTFCFRVGIDGLVNDDNIIGLLPNDLRDHFESLMYKMVLHGGSHTQDQILTDPKGVLQNLYSYEDKKRIAKEVICLLYLLNPYHVMSYLGYKLSDMEKRDVENTINEWILKIKQ